jgi:hypothetical protein
MTKTELYNMYFVKNLSISGICRETGENRRTIEKLLVEYELPKKSMSDTINGIKHQYLDKIRNRTAEDNDRINRKRKQTNLEKYGVENPFQSELIKEKAKQTNLEKYGVENPFQSPEVQDRYKSTMKDKYGVENPFQSELIKEKAKQTNLEKYGVENPFQSPEVQDRYKSTMKDKYGVENPGQMEDHSTKLKIAWENKTQSDRNNIKQNRERSMKQKYGVTYLIKSPEHYDKMCKVMYTKYNVKHGFQSTEIQLKCFESTSKTSRYKTYIMPSGKEVRIMGYEPQYLNKLLLEHAEDEIAVGAENVPVIQYVDSAGNRRKYFPDIFVQSTNTLYEVKSEYTFTVDEEINLLKHHHAKLAGFNHIIVILNENGEILNEIS